MRIKFLGLIFLCSLSLWGGLSHASANLDTSSGMRTIELKEPFLFDKEGKAQTKIEGANGFELLASYIRMMYVYGASIIGIICVLVLVISGVQMSLGGLNAELVNQSKERIFQSLLSLILLFCSSLLLKTINPGFFMVKEEVATSGSASGATGTGAGGSATVGANGAAGNGVAQGSANSNAVILDEHGNPIAASAQGGANPTQAEIDAQAAADQAAAQAEQPNDGSTTVETSFSIRAEAFRVKANGLLSHTPPKLAESMVLRQQAGALDDLDTWTDEFSAIKNNSELSLAEIDQKLTTLHSTVSTDNLNGSTDPVTLSAHQRLVKTLSDDLKTAQEVKTWTDTFNTIKNTSALSLKDRRFALADLLLEFVDSGAKDSKYPQIRDSFAELNKEVSALADQTRANEALMVELDEFIEQRDAIMLNPSIPDRDIALRALKATLHEKVQNITQINVRQGFLTLIDEIDNEIVIPAVTH